MREQLVHMGLATACLLILGSGCVTNTLEGKRLERYRPDTSGRTPSVWRRVSATGEVAVADTAMVAGDPKSSSGNSTSVRKLRKGAKVSIHLRGIPSPEEILEVIDDLGGVSLPLIGFVQLAGLTSSEAEKKIADAYISSGYYTSITIIVVALDEEYFVRGEVKREGRYPMAGELTLMQCIATAGGYTDYAKTSKISVMREGKPAMIYDASKIEKRRIPDPMIEPGDIIIVPRRWLW